MLRWGQFGHVYMRTQGFEFADMLTDWTCIQTALWTIQRCGQTDVSTSCICKQKEPFYNTCWHADKQICKNAYIQRSDVMRCGKFAMRAYGYKEMIYDNPNKRTIWTYRKFKHADTRIFGLCSHTDLQACRQFGHENLRSHACLPKNEKFGQAIMRTSKKLCVIEMLTD